MPNDPTQQLKTKLQDVLGGDLDQIPPSEREPFINMKKQLQDVSEESNTKTFFLVENLSDPESAFRVEQIFHNAGFEGANDQSTQWEGENLHYYASIEVKRKLYRRLRKGKLENNTSYVKSGSKGEERPEVLLMHAFSAAWEAWVGRPLRRIWGILTPS